MCPAVARTFWIYVLLLFNICIYSCKAQVQSYSFEINEELRGYHFVGSISVQDGQTYRLSVPDDRFTLNGATGELQTTGPIDRETLTDGAIINLIAVVNENSRQPVEIAVEVLDINDNDPYFESPASVYINIPETTESGTEYFLPSAKDTDGPGNSVSDKYSIISGDSSAFELIIDSAPGEDALLYLRTTSTFNREFKDLYTIIISATDDGQPPRQGFLNVEIQILDNNDNNPVFDISEYTAKISEKSKIGSFVVNVTATDEDQGENGKVRYRLSPSSDGKNLFQIDPETGVITLRNTLDFESIETYRLTLEAYDAGTPVLYGRAFVTVNVENENDNDPSINFRFFPSSATIASVNDGATVGNLVAILSVTDKDKSRDNDEPLKLSILSGNELGHFRLTLIPAINLGRLEVVGRINRQVIDRYNLTFFVEDNEFSTTRNTTASIEILVNSDNNHYPEFDQILYQSTLSELAPIGTFVQSVFAKDNDVGLPGRMKYSIVSGNQLGWFRVDEQTGLVTTNTLLNFNMLSFEDVDMTLEIVAMDESSSPLSTTTNLRITLKHENTNAPMFFTDFQEVKAETFPTDRLVTTVHATDADFGQNGIVTYIITGVSVDGILVGNYSDLFSINSQSGSIFAGETVGIDILYDITVQASDIGLPQLYTFMTIRYSVRPITNENPKFYPYQYFAESTPGPHSNLYICTLLAHTNRDGDIEYVFRSGNSGFHVDSSTGVVTASRAFTSQTTYVVLFDAIDSESKRTTEPAVVYIVINNDRSGIEFVQSGFEFAVFENIQLGVTIGEVALIDSNSNWIYGILNGDPSNTFSLTGGVLSLNNHFIDYEYQKQYNLSVVVYNENQQNIPIVFNTVNCTLIVKDFNDNIPTYYNEAVMISPTEYADELDIYLSRECTVVGSIISNISSLDLDSGLNGYLTYTLIDPLGIFSIDMNGIVTVVQPFCPTGSQQNDDVVVTSCDSGAPHHCAVLRLRINIHSSLKTILSAEIKQTVFETEIYEDAPVNTIILDLSTFLPASFQSPVKILPNGEIYTSVSYEMTLGNRNVFSIFPYGQIYLQSQILDRERTALYTLGVNITLRNENMDVYWYKVKVLINVLDINDNAPIFWQQNQTIIAPHTLLMHSEVGSCLARDEDTGIRGSVTYIIDTGTYAYNNIPLPFSVDKLSGVISTTSVIDREIFSRVWNVTDLFPLLVIATDNKGYESNVSFSTQTECFIQLESFNSFSPEFSKSYYSVKIPENTTPGTTVLSLQALDRDGDMNFFYKIINNQTTFKLDSSTGLLSLDTSISKKLIDVYILFVEVSDQAVPKPKLGVATIEIVTVVPIDLNPYFQNLNYSWSVPEDTHPGMEIGRFPIRDDNDNLVSYRFKSQESKSLTNKFYMESNSGRLILEDFLDRETDAVYNFKVIAYNFYNPSATTMLHVTIFVKDVNDNNPVFTSQHQFEIGEGYYIHPTIFGFLSASDLDAASNTQIKFSVLNVQPTSNAFTIGIQSNSGELTIQGDLDRELILPEHLIRITVAATDNEISRKALRATQIIDVFVNDINDNAPIFSSANVVFIPSQHLGNIGYEIATVSAEDGDFLENGSVSFSLVQVQSPPLFTIQPTTGILELNTEIPASDSIVHTVEVVARDQGVPSKFNSMELHIIVGSQFLNNGPVFQSNVYSGSVLENLGRDTFVLTVQAVGNQMAYYISGVASREGNVIHRRPFAIDSISGDVTTLMSLDREDISAYFVSVVAVDLTSSKANPRLTQTTIEIEVLDLNDVAPIFTQSVDEIFLSELELPGFIITKITATDADLADNIKYALEVWPTGSNEFLINLQNGEIRVGNNGLDYERDTKYILKVIAGDGIHTTTKEILINIIDSNDNSPRFISDPFEFSIIETPNTRSNTGLFIGSVAAEDIDSFPNSKLTYSIVEDSNNGIFVMNGTTGSLSIRNDYVGLLDREENDLYVFKVMVTDNGGLLNVATVFVNIIDINDNAPTFLSQENTFNILESAPVGYNIATIEAVDIDFGYFGRIEYKIVAGDQNSQFTIIPDNGHIILRVPLDYETQKEYYLTVMAYDLAPPKDRLASFFNLTINVLDVNDNPPNIIIPGIIYINEDRKPGSVLLKIGAFDVESYETTGFQYSLIYQYPNEGLFRIDSGELYLGNTQLNREITDHYDLSIEVKDQEIPSLSSVVHLQIIVLDSNDNQPIFTTSNYIAHMSEDTRLGTNVIKVIATDDDIDWNGKIGYKIMSSSMLPFEIEFSTGQIYLIGRLDYEKVSKYELVVQACDDGIPRLSSNTTVTINVLDVNDLSPVLTPSTLIKHVQENKISDVITKFTVHDNDTGEGGKVDFRSIMVTSVMKNGDYVESEQDFSSLFSVSYDGILTIDEPVSREVADMFNVVVNAVDRGTPQLTGSASVLVIIDDENEFDPYFRPKTYQASIPTNTPFNSEVLGVVAVDIDDGKYGYVRYSISHGSNTLPFIINPTTGMISTSTIIESNTYNFMVIASNEIDRNGIVRSGSANVTIFVGESSGLPMFSEPFYTGHVAEDVVNGVIATVTVPGGDFIYLIDPSNSEDYSKFSLVDGALRNIEKLDREEKQTYILSILARDPHDLSLVASTSVYVVVDDVNDNPPNFPRLYSTSIREDAMIGDFVILVSSTDPDSQENSQNRYFLSDNINETFTIDEFTGQVTVNKKLDREMENSYQLIVNTGDQDWETHTTLTITITDANDYPPKFEQSNYSFSVTNLNPGDFVFAISTKDKDFGINQQVFYSLITDVDYLWIDHISGKVYTTITLGCSDIMGSSTECPHRIMASVCASDGGFPLPLTSSTNVEIIVEKQNLNKPEFELILSPVAVLQSSDINTEVIFVTATDVEDDFEITYLLLDSLNSQYFAIDNKTGVISTVNSLRSLAIGSEITITVQADDNGVPSFTSELSLVIEVAGQNLNRPQFERHSYESSKINEDVEIGTPLFTVTAFDDDIGINGKIKYSLSQDDIDKPFTIDQTSGVLSTTELLDYEEITLYTLTIIASDRAVNSQSTSATVVIPIKDVNDNIPKFNSSYFVAYVKENIPPQTIFTRLLAEDLDTSDNAIINYNIYPHTIMSIRTLTGDVFTGMETLLDFESRDRYNYTVSASNNIDDYGDNSTLIVRVCGQNEFAPQFSSSILIVTTPTNASPGEEVIKLEATDNDLGNDGEIIFTFAEWSKNLGFDLNQLTGGVTVSQNANLGLGNIISLQVYAKNPGEFRIDKMVEVDIFVTVVTDECSKRPCRNGATCIDGSVSFTCLCAPGYSGEFCEIELNECDPNPCFNSAQCIDLMGSFTCICDLAYTGFLCEIQIDFCEENPCLNGGSCSGGNAGYSCQCSFGYTGQNCEIGSMGFEPSSFLTLPTLNIAQNQISFEFATVSHSSLLFYNHAAMNQTDFVALELVNGELRLSYQHQSSNINRLTVGVNLADGNWHSVEVSIGQLTTSLSVSNCNENINQDIRCSETQSHNSLSFSAFENEPLYFGGVPNIEVVLTHPNQISSFDFVGCIRSLNLNDELISTPSSAYILKFENVLDQCIRTDSLTGACSNENSQPTCGVNSNCVDRWSYAECKCPDDKSGSTCQNERTGSTFNGEVYLSYSFKPSIMQQAELEEANALLPSSKKRKKRQFNDNDSSISIRFRTRNENGVLYLVQGYNNDRAILYIENNHLYYSYSSTQNIVVMENISDGMWRTVKVELLNTNAQVLVSVEGSLILESTVSVGIKSFVDPLEVKTIYVGGGPSQIAFDGCVFSFYLNEEQQPLADDGGSSYLIVTQNGVGASQSVTLGCDGNDVCASNPCAPPLYCNDIWNAYECIPLGQCAAHPCLNSGTCIPIPNGTYQCQCSINYEGENCETFIPCLAKDCDILGPNQICIADVNAVGGTACICNEGYTLIQDKCELVIVAGFPLWIIGVIVGILLLIVVVVLVSICYCRKKRNATKSPDEPIHHNGVDLNGNCGNNHNAFEFQAMNGSPTSNGMHITNNNAEEDLTSSTVVNTGDPSDLGEHEKEHVTGNGQNSTLKHKPSFSNNSISPPKSLLLPSYDVIMQKRNSLQQEELSARGTSPMYEKRSRSVTPKIPSIVASSCENCSDIASVSSSHKRGQKSRTRTPVGVDLPISEIIDSDNLSVYKDKVPQYLPNGRSSPLKSMTAMSLLRNTQRPNGYSSRPPSYIPPSISDRSRRVSGSAASSSTTSSFEHDQDGSYVSSDKVATVEDMVKHLKGLVGLTSEEIAVLNESSQISGGSTTNGSVTSSYPSVIEPPVKRTPVSNNNPYRPSSLPGRRINSVFTGTRSKTPMATPMHTLYKKSPVGYNLPVDLYPSEHLQPPPDTSTDEDEVLFVSKRKKKKKFNRTSFCDDISEADDTDPSPVKGFNLDILNAYGKHYEQLAGVFIDLACLPSLNSADDDRTEIESSTPSYASHSTRTTGLKSSLASKSSRIRTVSQGSSEQSGKLRITSHPGRHSAVPALCLSTSPNSMVSSSRSHSSTAKRRSEHYV